MNILRRMLWCGFVALIAAPTLHAQTVFLSDLFTTGANQTLQAHTPNTGGAWTRQLGAGLSIAAASDDIRNTVRREVNLYSNATIPPDDEYAVGINVTFTNNDSDNIVLLFGRGNVVAGDGYLISVASTGFVTMTLYDNLNDTLLFASAGAALSLNVAHQIVLTIRDARKELFVDGVSRGFTTNNAVTGFGVLGLGLSSENVGETRGDNFFAGTFAPTAATMFEADAVRDDAGLAAISWSTAREADNLGFLVHRRSGGESVPLTRSLIAGSAFLAGRAALPAGHAYRWFDPDAPEGAEYWIEEIDLQRNHRWHGPIVARRGHVDARPEPSPSLPRLGVATAGSRQVTAHASTTGRRRSAGGAAPERRQFTLAAGAATKIAVDREGWYRVPLPLNADPSLLALYEDGREIPILIEGDSLLFYGRPLDSPWSAERVYWLTQQATPGRRIARAAASDATNEQRSYTASVERRDKTIFFAALMTDEPDSFVGPVISTDTAQPTVQELTLSHVVAERPSEVTVTVQGGTGGDHRVDVALNGRALGTMELNGQERRPTTFALPANVLREGLNEVTFAARGGAEDINAVVAVRIDYGRSYRAENDALLMTVAAGSRALLEGFTTPGVRLFDITDPTSPEELEVRDSWAAPRGNGVRTLIALTAFAQPARIEANEPSTLYRTGNADLAIVVHPSLRSAIEPLRVLREQQGLRVEIALTTDIYDEFSFGAKDPSAIRRFLNATRPRNVLLAGDASIDPRNYIGGAARDLVPTHLAAAGFQRTASDIWFTDFDDDGISELPVGRLPAGTSEEASAIVAKLLSYDTAPAGDWSRKALIVGDAEGGIDYTAHAATPAGALPPQWSQATVSVAATGIASAHQQLLQQLDAGAGLVFYSGHGSVEAWSAQRLLTREQALSLHNGTRLPVVVGMTCLNGYFHDAGTESLAESLLRAKDGGAVAIWTSSGLTDPLWQGIAGTAFTDAVANGGTFGAGLLAAQRASLDSDVRRTFLLFGDPSMRLR
jgi:hypothetical protein